MKIYIAGSAVTKFGELWDTSSQELGLEAMSSALRDSGLKTTNLQALFVGNMLSGILSGQEHQGPLYAELLNSSLPSFHIEGACASGGLAVHNAINSLLSGRYQTVMVLGVEKMTDYSSELVSQALMAAGSESERDAGATFPGLYALLARSHMAKFGTTERELAAVSVKNHYHASLNPNAQFRHPISIDQVMASGYVADPLKLLDCSPISDGAAAVILTTKRIPSATEIIASSVASDSLDLASRANLYSLKATQLAAVAAFSQAGLKPKDISVAEVHDCFSIAEILALEDLGFFSPGKAAAAVANNQLTLGSSTNLVVNPSGGLKGCGHPVGATGIKQIVELNHQLKGSSGTRQVKPARYGLTHNVGGSGATAVIHILKAHD
jgi:acetyl-CoA C-acetyltransferase